MRKNIPLLFSSGAFYSLPIGLTARLARESGYDGLELVLDPTALLFGQERIKRLSEKRGAPVKVLHPSLFRLPGWSDIPLAFKRLGQWALALDCQLIVLHPPRNRGLVKEVADFDQGLLAMERVTKGRVRITVENVAVFRPEDRQGAFVWPERVAEFARARGLGMTFDTTHVASVGLPLLSAYKSVEDIVEHVHMSDFSQPPKWLNRPSFDTYFKHHQLLGSGELPLALLLQNLQKNEYKGCITLELSPVALQVWRPWALPRVLSQMATEARWAAHVADELSPVLATVDK